MKVSELEGAALNYWVAKAEGEDVQYLGGKMPLAVSPTKSPSNSNQWNSGPYIFAYCTDWAQGGPIIEREKIETEYRMGNWGAETIGLDAVARHGSLLVAAMRAHVENKFGNEVPEERWTGTMTTQ